GDEVVAPAEQPSRAGDRAEREDILPPQPHPDLSELEDAVLVGMARDPGGVDRPDRGADHKVRTDLIFKQGSEHPDLDGAQAPATGEDKGARTFPRRAFGGEGGAHRSR